MTRKQTPRRIWQPLPPKGLRAPLFVQTRTTLAIAHLENLDLVSRGKATEDELWHLVEQALTWSRVAHLLGVGEPEMAAQLELATQVVQRYGRTGRIGFSGVEYQAAKQGVDVMDELARLVDQPTAAQATAWSEARIRRLRYSAAESQQCCKPARHNARLSGRQQP